MTEWEKAETGVFYMPFEDPKLVEGLKRSQELNYDYNMLRPSQMEDLFILTSEQAQHQGQDNPNQSDPLGGLSQQLIQAAALVLVHVGIGRAGQSAGQASLLTRLQQNHNDQGNRANSLKNSQNNLEHIGNLPPRVLAD